MPIRTHFVCASETSLRKRSNNSIKVKDSIVESCVGVLGGLEIGFQVGQRAMAAVVAVVNSGPVVTERECKDTFIERSEKGMAMLYKKRQSLPACCGGSFSRSD